ncbi:MAG: RhuM family protein [Patescibacteria group bacterium]
MKNKEQNKINKGEIKIYKPKKGGIEFQVRFEKETVWADAHQIANIFGVNRPAVVKHINNIYKIGELDKKTTCSILEQVATDKKIRKMNLYNLDMIISVGYRVNSYRATEFRKWATTVLKKYLIDGYAINQKRLLETENNFNRLRETVLFLQKQAKKDLLKGQEIEI